MLKLPHHGMPESKPDVFKSRTEKAIEEFAAIDCPKMSDINKLNTISQVEAGVLEMMQYISKGYHGMTRTQLEEEEHCSAKLGERMTALGEERPDDHDAHAIVSGAHPRAATLRGILAKYKIRIDDPDNGCWLPHNTKAKKKTGSPAVPHSRIHRKNYYLWMDSYIHLPTTKDETYCRFQLNMIRLRLLNMCELPNYVMLAAHEEITA